MNIEAAFQSAIQAIEDNDYYGEFRAWDQIAIRARQARTSPLRWLLKRMTQQSLPKTEEVALSIPVSETETYSCDTCGAQFKNRHALCGHQKKHRS